jgi:thymidylate synthase ThyX
LCWVTSKNSEGRAGIGYKAIAAATGLAKSTLAMILTGKRTETRIVVTANARALRHFLKVRGSIEGDSEMRSVSAELLKTLRAERPTSSGISRCRPCATERQ